jgi:hypothetical protein
MVEHTISTKKALSEVIFIDNIIEGCWQNSIVDSDEPFESEYNKVIKDIELCNKINKELVDAVAEVLERNGIDLSYSFVELDKQEILKKIEHLGPIYITSLWSLIEQYYEKDNFEEDIRELHKDGKIIIENEVLMQNK